MAETTADVKRDIELTRERMTATLAQLERKLNLQQVVRDNPWPALGVAFGAGLLLSGSRADVKAAAATAVATRGASSRVGAALDDIVANLMRGLGGAIQGQVDSLVEQVKVAIGAPGGDGALRSAQGARGLADVGAGGGSGGIRAQRDEGVTPSVAWQGESAGAGAASGGAGWSSGAAGATGDAASRAG